MAEMKNPFVWYELMTTDVDAAAAFYSAVVGWEARDSGMAGFDYRLFYSGDGMVAGLMAQPEESRAAGNPPGWLGYVGVADVDAATEKATSLGATVYVEPRDIPEVGRFSVIADPQGAVVALFGSDSEPPPSPGMATPGQIGWNELYASDWETLLPFYVSLFGWQKGTAVDMGPMGTYQLMVAGSADEAFGGTFNKPPQVPANFWLYYFTVDSIDPATERVKANGGTVLNGPMEVPGGSFIVQCMDPQGAMFALTGPRK